jgi:hypothetical protein
MNATATGNSNGIVVTNANNVTIMNGSLTYTGTAYNFMLILLQNTVNATVENIQFNGTGAAITQPGNTAVMDDYGIGTLVTSNSVDQLAQGVFFQNCTGCVAVDNIINRGNALAFDSSANCLFKHNTVTYTAGISNTQAMALGATDQYIGNAFIGYPSSAQIIIGGINIVGK